MSTPAFVGMVAAGAVGAPVRFMVDGFVRQRCRDGFPWGTFAVNVTGSLILGVLTGLGLYHAFPATPRLVLGTGFCGAYTTFSTFSVDTVRLLEQGAVGAALCNAFGTLLVCGAAAAAGVALAGL